MTKELQNELVRKYPEFFDYLKENQDGPLRPMLFGFECHDGWYTIIDILMSTIQSYIKWNHKGMKIELKQVKEKFGGLRFYIDGGDNQIDGMVTLAEHLSYATCEFCGTTNEIGRTTHWIFTICKQCFDAGKTTQTEWKSLEQIYKEFDIIEKSGQSEITE